MSTPAGRAVNSLKERLDELDEAQELMLEAQKMTLLSLRSLIEVSRELLDRIERLEGER